MGICSYSVLMHRKWKDLDELLDALARRAIAGKPATLTPETAALLVNALRDAAEAARPSGRLSVDLYAEGSTIYRLDQAGEAEEVVGWAKNALVARAALEELKRRYPEARFMQRRRSWVEWK